MGVIGNGQFWMGDCLELMKDIPDASVDMVLCDLPYGTTACKWDTVIPFEPLWEQYWRIAKPNAAVVLSGQQPFAASLIMSQPTKFRYEWVWEKTAATGFLNAKKAPLKAHELFMVFYDEQPSYNPQMTDGAVIKRVNASYADHGANYGKAVSIRAPYESTQRYPRDVIKFAKDNRIGGLHPTQKPVALFEYLIRTYTDPGMTVLDNCAGSGTTAIAAERTGRKWICIEQDLQYYLKAYARVWGEVHA